MSFIFLIAVLSNTALARVAVAADSQALLDRHVEKFSTYRGWRLDFCRRIIAPCGWEAAAEDDMSAKGTERLTVSSGTVRQLLDKFVADYPDYSWAIKDEVINFLPKPGKAMVKDGVPIADFKIKNLSVEGLPINQAARKICEAAGLKCAGIASAGIRRHYGKVSLHLKDVTLRQALNALVKQDGMSAWAVEFNRYGNDYAVSVDSWRPGASLSEDKRQKIK